MIGLLGLTCTCSLLVSACWSGTQVDAAVRDAINNSDFIFEGTVLVPDHASTMAVVEPNALTAKVHIDRVIYSAPNLAGSAGRNLTLTLAQGISLDGGERKIFFTKGLFLGASLEVALVYRLAIPSVTASSLTFQTISLIRLQTLATRRFNQADAVLQGHIISNRTVIVRVHSEHNPMWAVATLKVDHAFKGDNHNVFLAYPTADDPFWRLAPKFPVGAAGLWLLIKDKKLGGYLHVPSHAVYTALEAGQYFSAHDTPEVLHLLGLAP